MILERLRYAEAKNTIVVTLLGVLIIGGFRIYDETPDRHILATIYFWCFIFFSLIAIIAALSSFMPNIKLQYLYKPKEPANTDSLIYYEHVSKFDDAKSYIDAVNRTYFNSEAVPGNLDYDLGAQIILNARSVYRKSVLSYYAITFTVCAILTPVLGGLFVLISRHFYWTSENGKTKLKFGRKKVQREEEIKEIRHNPIGRFTQYFNPNPRKRTLRVVEQNEKSENVNQNEKNQGKD
ncbi:hypothetical protein LJC08_01250 [Methanimicrococcus sp. OttesenSCG-928-J09]|nr:hypothetical protein [Methanimicrococcus sp. OttesenSCG-928-J09]